MKKFFLHIARSSRVDCAIQIDFNLDAVDRRWKLLHGKRY